LNNTIRHARANQVGVFLINEPGRFMVVIEDNGIGFIPSQVCPTDRLGLFGMRERAEMVGGQIQVCSAPGKGTKIIVEVPYADPIAGS
jgi:two-component system, NarL family, sensor histidine kinase NreB